MVLAFVVVLALPPLDAFATVQRKAAKKRTVTVTKTVVGPLVPCHKWGPIKVAVKVAQTKTTVGATTTVTALKILSVTVPVVPNHTVRSVFINQKALPLLVGEVMQLQSDKIEAIAGATNTTDSFKQSLSAALLAANKP